jgi:hypothetical protein
VVDFNVLFNAVCFRLQINNNVPPRRSTRLFSNASSSVKVRPTRPADSQCVFMI